MTRFPVNVHRRDPYKTSKFQVVLDGRIVPDVVRISGLTRRTETVLYRDGALESHFITAPGTTTFDPIIIERAITHDTTFEDWAALAFNRAGDSAMSLREFRKDMTINLLNQQGTVVLSYMVYRCWVSEYTALPELDANGNTVAIETVTLENEGWERDRAVGEPQET